MATSLTMAARRAASFTRFPSSTTSSLVQRRSLAGAATHHGPPKVNFWKEPMNPAQWKEEHEFTAAIEEKQVVVQEAERAKFIIEKAEQEKRSAVIRAQGEAKSSQLIGQAIANNPAFITLRKIEVARDIAHTISNSANKVYLSADDLLLNLQDLNWKKVSDATIS